MLSKTGQYSFIRLYPSGQSLPQSDLARLKKQTDFAKYQYDETKSECELKKVWCIGFASLVGFLGGCLIICGYEVFFWVAVAAAMIGILYTKHLNNRVGKAFNEFCQASEPSENLVDVFHRNVTEAARSWMQTLSPNIGEHPIKPYVNGKLNRFRKRLMYSPKHIVYLDFAAETVAVIYLDDIREVKISSPGYKSSGTVEQTIEGNSGNALRGAIMGDLLVGDDWGAAGAVIGAAGPRESVQHVNEEVKTLWSVDVYTKVAPLSLFTQDFGTDASAAKKFYSIISNSEH